MSQTAGALVFLHAQTAIHAGSGSALGVVDLPIQRERHTQWPMLPGSSLKGVFRDVLREEAFSQLSTPDRSRKVANGDDLVTTLFGPEAINASKHAGALSVADGRLLCFPVRSLKGVHAWITCPAVLERFGRDLQLTGVAPKALAEVAPIESGKAIVFSDRLVIKSGTSDQKGAKSEAESRLVLEEFDFIARKAGPSDTVWNEFLMFVAREAIHPSTAGRFKESLVVLSDGDFQHFVRYATEVFARIALNPETKTTLGTALFYAEAVPAESIFYAPVLCSGSRKAGDLATAVELRKKFCAALTKQSVIQVGGEETTGKGFCWARSIEGVQQ
jgi:CRISPR-associated protein Cmr4